MDLVTFREEILNGKLHSLSIVSGAGEYLRVEQIKLLFSIRGGSHISHYATARIKSKMDCRRRSGVFIVNFKHILQLVLVFLLLNLSRYMPTGKA